MRSAFGGQFVKLGFTACLGRLPVGGQQLFVFEAMKSGIKVSLLDLQGFARHLLNPLRDRVAVNGAKRNYPHDEEIEGALRKSKLFIRLLHACCFYIYTRTCRRSRRLFLTDGVRPQSRVDS